MVKLCHGENHVKGFDERGKSRMGKHGTLCLDKRIWAKFLTAVVTFPFGTLHRAVFSRLVRGLIDVAVEAETRCYLGKVLPKPP